MKLTTEAVRLALTPSELGKAELYARLADERIEEITAMAAEGKADEVEMAADRLDAHLVAMAEVAGPWQMEDGAPAGGALRSPVMTTATTTAAVGMAEVAPEEAPQAPAPDLPAATGEQKALKSYEMNGKKGAGGEEDAAVDNVTSFSVVAAEGGGEPPRDERAELKQNLAVQAAEHHQALRRALENTPESARDALRRAIDKADRGYRQALGALE